MSADKDNAEQIDNLIAQSLRAIVIAKITSDAVKRRFSQDIQNENIGFLRLKQTQNYNAAWSACLFGIQKSSKSFFAVARWGEFFAQFYSKKLRQA